MAINKQTRLFKYGQELASHPIAVRKVNRGLARSIPRVPPLPLRDEEPLRPTYAHLGSGAYDTGRTVSAHQHTALQVEYILNGRFVFRADDQRVELAGGQGVALLPGQKHRWRCGRRGVMLGVMVHLNRQGRTAEQIRREHPLPRMRFARPQTAEAMAGVLDVILDNAPRRWREEETGLRFGVWLAAALDEAWPKGLWAQAPERSDHEEVLCQRAEAFIQANLHQPIALGDVAAEAGVSERHLNRLYRRLRGKTVGRALLQARVERATELLTDQPDCPIKTVGYRCGFHSPAHFTARFRHEIGFAPRTYRDRTRAP